MIASRLSGSRAMPVAPLPFQVEPISSLKVNTPVMSFITNPVIEIELENDDKWKNI